MPERFIVTMGEKTGKAMAKALLPTPLTYDKSLVQTMEDRETRGLYKRLLLISSVLEIGGIAQAVINNPSLNTRINGILLYIAGRLSHLSTEFQEKDFRKQEAQRAASTSP